MDKKNQPTPKDITERNPIRHSLRRRSSQALKKAFAYVRLKEERLRMFRRRMALKKLQLQEANQLKIWK